MGDPDALVWHVVKVTDQPRRIDCADGCDGPEPHLHEYRASNIRPTPEATKRMQDPKR